jgi:hypothetical protein
MDVGTIRWGGAMIDPMAVVPLEPGGEAKLVGSGAGVQRKKIRWREILSGASIFSKGSLVECPTYFFIYVRKILWALHFIS